MAQEKCAVRGAGDGGEVVEQESVVGRVVPVAPGIARRDDARSTVESVDLEAGVVGQRPLTGEVADGTRLDQRVRGEGVAVLLDVRGVREVRHGAQRPRLRAEEPEQFDELVAVAGGDDDRGEVHGSGDG